MRKRFTRCVAVLAGVAFTAAATALAGPGPIHRPTPTTTQAKTPALHVSVPTAASLPSGRYAWRQPVFVRLPSGLFLIVRSNA